MSKNKKQYWDKEKFIEIVKAAKTITEILNYFGLPKNQGCYNRIFHKYIKENNINIDHLLKFNKQRVFSKKIPLKELLVSGTFRATTSLKERLLKENLIFNKCYECNLLSEWNGRKLVLHLDHIDGNNTNNLINNLRLLCPNCHSQTETYCGSNKKNKQNAYKYICKKCGSKKKTTDSIQCINCANNDKVKNTKILWPDPNWVLDQVKINGYSKVGKILGVSYAAVKKFLERNNLKIDN